MEPLDAFLTMWERARATFGEGVPHDRTEFDKSADLLGMQDQVRAAAPGAHWTGAAADMYSDANDKHVQALGRLADIDKRMGDELERSADVVNGGRNELDSLKQWVTDLADEAKKTPTAAADHALWSGIAKASGDVADIIQRSHTDLSGVAGRIQGLDGEFSDF
ncbi:EspA/EspE family type VII secretion system effector [Mycolicibacterium sp. CBMA 234]|uniref:EspA/EspE family type VII secretion system effector n=1 Tax=Mycolicibacterium sp. CBMA 234 TaxID=1918495 RepID=UPI0012DBDC56|nr:EspA/EspE family type VII secretion system effector [Mycolicibacterium sp. CBMA 234]